MIMKNQSLFILLIIFALSACAFSNAKRGRIVPEDQASLASVQISEALLSAPWIEAFTRAKNRSPVLVPFAQNEDTVQYLEQLKWRLLKAGSVHILELREPVDASKDGFDMQQSAKKAGADFLLLCNLSTSENPDQMSLQIEVLDLELGSVVQSEMRLYKNNR